MEESEFVEKYIDPIMKKLDLILTHMKVKKIVETKLADFSKEKVSHERSKPMPEQLGKYTVAKKGCNRCGGKITWDNYDKEEHPYPDHLSVHGDLIACPEYKPWED
jgi:hypothetical protein